MPTSRKAKKVAARKPATAAQRPTKARGATPRKKPAGREMPARRADYGAPIDGFFAKQPAHLRVILETLRELVAEAAPEATASLKWGMPFYSVGSEMMCAVAGFKAHVNLILAGPPGTFADPGGLLDGEGKSGRHLKLRKLEELPREAVRGWLRAAAELAREKAARS